MSYLKLPYTRGITDEEKENAVVRMMTGKGTAQEIAEDMGVKRLALRNWKRRVLEEVVLPTMPAKKGVDVSVEELEEMKTALEADIDKLELKRAVMEGTVGLLGKGRRSG